MARVDEMEHGDEYEETLTTLLEVSRTPEGRASLSDELRDILHFLPVSPSRLLLLRLRLLRNLLAGDELNQITFVHLSGPAVVASSVLSFPTVAPDVARAPLSRPWATPRSPGSTTAPPSGKRSSPGRCGSLRRSRMRGCWTLSAWCSTHAAPVRAVVGGSRSCAMTIWDCPYSSRSSPLPPKNAVDAVDFTCRGISPLPTGSPAIDVLGYSLQLLRDICAWESSSLETQLPVDSLLQTGLIKRLLKYLGKLEPPSTIRKSMAKGQGDQQPTLANGKVCPYIGYRRDLVAIIANCLHGRKKVQDEVRKLDGIMLLLQQCVVDEENPYLREWGLLAVKNLLEGNEENQKEVSQLEMQEPVLTPEIANMGLKVEIDMETGRPKLVNTP
ncbi:hypothetical protein PR202_gb18382 [Eleusine coracana subsp. coracana]|uniref:Ataxin-10 domain-containing protein n=1 Tax=Eleusine coracana subsp. coracana TaxID=191504 RepID=A0AAV5F359_ELECO|nr:hypothetical protein PR202_gb18382 [Eleusine coracana subsp. coracana]